MRESKTDLIKKALQFKGYGGSDPHIIFMGIEEGGDNFNQRIEHLDKIDLQNDTADCKEFHEKALYKKDEQRFHLPDDKETLNSLKVQNTWNYLCRIMLSMEGLPQSKYHALWYQSEYLGRKKGLGNNTSRFFSKKDLPKTPEKRTLLTELFPIPKKYDKSESQNASLLQEFINANNLESLAKLRENMMTGEISKEGISRKRMLRDFIKKNHNLEMIMCYGKGHWREYEQLINNAFPEIQWKGLVFGKKGLRRLKDGERTPDIKWTSLETTQSKPRRSVNVFLTPFMGNGQFSIEKCEALVRFHKG